MHTYIFEVYPLATDSAVSVEHVSITADSLKAAQTILYKDYGYTHWIGELPLKVE